MAAFEYKAAWKGWRRIASTAFTSMKKATAPAATASAGGHFNPGQQAHGKFGDSKAHHIGDLPSLDADTQGVATIDFVSKEFKLDRGSNGILGRSLIVHNDPDDYTTQPTGNSGARLACAVIERGA
jgi:Cu-Zn family superoxide dismutase